MLIRKVTQSAPPRAQIIDNLESTSATDALSANMGRELKSLIGEGGASGDTLPIGSITGYPSDNIPDNWLLCDGSEISREEYSELFEAIGTLYGEGDGFTTFNIPNIKGKAPVGKDENDTDFDTIGKTGGEKEHTLTESEIPSMDVHMTKNSWYDRGGLENGGANNRRVVAGGATGGDTGYIIGTVNGGDQAHNNMPPYIITNYIIKVKQSSGVVATVVDSLNSDSKINALSANQGKILDAKIEQKGDPLPVGTIVDYDGTDIPDGYIEVEEEKDVYSTTEYKTNKVWINNKPIYRKVIDIGSITKAQQKTGDTGIRDWDNIISQIGVAFNGTNYGSRPDFFVYKSGTTLRYSAYNSSESNTQCYLTVEYTKTTD